MQNRAKVNDALQRKFYSLVKEPMHFAKLLLQDTTTRSVITLMYMKIYLIN